MNNSTRFTFVVVVAAAAVVDRDSAADSGSESKLPTCLRCFNQSTRCR